MAVLGRQAATGLEVELPTVQMAGQHAVADVPEDAQIGLAMGTPPLHHVAAELDLLDLASASARTMRSEDKDLKKL